MQEEGALGRFHRNRYEEAINKQSGATDEQAKAQAREAVGATPKKKGVLDTVKEFFMGEDQDSKDPQRKDADFASAVGAMYLNAPGADRIYADMASSENPGAMIGLMAAKAVMRANDQLQKRGMPVDSSVWAAENGVLEDLLDEAFSNSKAYTGLEPDEQMFQTAYSAAISALKNGAGQKQPKPAGPQSALRGMA